MEEEEEIFFANKNITQSSQRSLWINRLNKRIGILNIVYLSSLCQGVEEKTHLTFSLFTLAPSR